jgi:hypothetical protein
MKQNSSFRRTPESRNHDRQLPWIPAFAGMTEGKCTALTPRISMVLVDDPAMLAH